MENWLRSYTEGLFSTMIEGGFNLPLTLMYTTKEQNVLQSPRMSGDTVVTTVLSLSSDKSHKKLSSHSSTALPRIAY